MPTVPLDGTDAASALRSLAVAGKPPHTALMRTAQWSEPVSVLDRIIAVLEAVREAHGSTTITQIARATGIPKSTVSRLVADLVTQRYLARSEDGVGIGLRLF